jgi:hypothetical protein
MNKEHECNVASPRGKMDRRAQTVRPAAPFLKEGRGVG